MKKSRIFYLTVFTLMAFCFCALPVYAQTFCSTDVPLRIPPLPDGSGPGTTFSTLNVELSNGQINDVIVRLYIDHTYQGDLVTTLISPNNIQVLLFDGVDGGNNNFGTTCGLGDSSPDFILNDNASTPVGDINTSDPVGSFIPEEPLSTFDGQSPTGTWTLEIFDQFGGDIGNINCWCLEIDATPRAVPTLSEWGLISLAAVLGIVGFMVIRRRKATA